MHRTRLPNLSNTEAWGWMMLCWRAVLGATGCSAAIMVFPLWVLAAPPPIVTTKKFSQIAKYSWGGGGRVCVQIPHSWKPLAQSFVRNAEIQTCLRHDAGSIPDHQGKAHTQHSGPHAPLGFLGHVSHVYTVVTAVQSLSQVQLFSTPWAAAHQAPLSFTISQSLLRLMSIESVVPSIRPSRPVY